MVERTAQLVRRGTEGEEDHLVGTDVAIALHQVEIGGPQVRADGNLYLAPRSPTARQVTIEDGEAVRQLVGGEAEGIPALAQFGDAPDGGVALAAEVDGRMRVLDRL